VTGWHSLLAWCMHAWLALLPDARLQRVGLPACLRACLRACIAAGPACSTCPPPIASLCAPAAARQAGGVLPHACLHPVQAQAGSGVERGPVCVGAGPGPALVHGPLMRPLPGGTVRGRCTDQPLRGCWVRHWFMDSIRGCSWPRLVQGHHLARGLLVCDTRLYCCTAVLPALVNDWSGRGSGQWCACRHVHADGRWRTGMMGWGTLDSWQRSVGGQDVRAAVSRCAAQL
jgi:hypothetical protein